MQGGVPTPTRNQLLTLAAIDEFSRHQGTGPTYKELRQALGLSSDSSVQYRVQVLAELGWLTYSLSRGKGNLASRSLRLTDAGAQVLSQYSMLYTSHLLRGELQLALNTRELALAGEIHLPFDTLHLRGERDKYIITFNARAERDLWARLLLQAMAQKE